MLIDGRRWRRTDPTIPERLRAELTTELMSARRAVKESSAASADAEADARARVHDAKVALGERGTPWWERTSSGDEHRAAATIRALLRHRTNDSSICPSDVARVIGGSNWRTAMPVVRAVAQAMEGDGVIVVTQKGERAQRPWRGPLRLRRAD